MDLDTSSPALLLEQGKLFFLFVSRKVRGKEKKKAQSFVFTQVFATG